MTSDDFTPPLNVIANMEALQEAIANDPSGDETRKLVAYFHDASLKSTEMKLHTQDFQQKEFARALDEAFAASARIISAAWQKAHGRELAA